MDVIDEALLVLSNLIKTLISVLIETIKLMLTILADVASTTIKFMFKKNK